MSFIYQDNSGKWQYGGVEQPGGTEVFRGRMEENNEYGVRQKIGAEVIVIKVPGRTYWTGHFMPRGYAGAEFQVFKIREEKQDGLLVDFLFSFPVSTPKKKEE